jgi:hypothetical protein
VEITVTHYREKQKKNLQEDIMAYSLLHITADTSPQPPGEIMSSIQGKIPLLFAFLLLFVACGGEKTTTGTTEATLHIDLPGPLSERGAGIPVSPDSTSRIMSDVLVDIESIDGDLDDITNVVIVVIPALISFDTTSAPLAGASPVGPQALQADSTIVVSFYLAESGTIDPFQEEFLAATFYIGIEGTQVTVWNESASIPASFLELILSGNMRIGVEVESSVRGRLVIESVDLTFFF